MNIGPNFGRGIMYVSAPQTQHSDLPQYAAARSLDLANRLNIPAHAVGADTILLGETAQAYDITLDGVENAVKQAGLSFPEETTQIDAAKARIGQIFRRDALKIPLPL